MENINELFRDHYNEFTIYVVEKKFVVGRGLDFFKSYKGTENYIDTDELAQKRINKIFSWIEKKIPSVAELIKLGFEDLSTVSIIDVIVILNKLCGSQKHQAAGPEAIDPIIIQEGTVLKKYINQIINLHKDSFIRPAIIIMLKDNDFSRAKKLLSECPDGTNIKFIYNDEKSEMCKVINTGADNIEGFIDSFSHQCFSTCSKTPHNILLNEEWAGNSLVKQYAPSLLRYRSNLLCDEKLEIEGYLNLLINKLENQSATSEQERILINNFLCIAKLYRVYCKDFGGSDILDAYNLAKDLDNELLLAYVYKNGFFFPNKNINEQNSMLQKGYEIFIKNNMADNALYCKNNILVRQFDTNMIYVNNFNNMLGEAISDVPGLVGMSHIYNNTAIAHMMTANPDRAMELFDKGLEYSSISERQVQHLALICNKLITQSYYGEKIDYVTIRQVMLRIFDGMVRKKQLPFIAARYAMNLVIIAMRQDKRWAKDLLQEFDIIGLINRGLQDNVIGNGQLLLQLDYLEQKLPENNIKSKCHLPKNIIKQTGMRKEFIEKSGLNPFYFFTWL